MASRLDLDERCSDEFGRAIIERQRALGESCEEVELGERLREALQRRNIRDECLEQLIVEQLLARERALPRGERLVFEVLELGRDVTLGILQRLAAAVIVRYLVGLRARDFYVEDVHA